MQVDCQVRHKLWVAIEESDVDGSQVTTCYVGEVELEKATASLVRLRLSRSADMFARCGFKGFAGLTFYALAGSTFDPNADSPSDSASSSSSSSSSTSLNRLWVEWQTETLAVLLQRVKYDPADLPAALSAPKTTFLSTAPVQQAPTWRPQQQPTQQQPTGPVVDLVVRSAHRLSINEEINITDAFRARLQAGRLLTPEPNSTGTFAYRVTYAWRTDDDVNDDQIVVFPDNVTVDFSSPRTLPALGDWFSPLPASFNVAPVRRVRTAPASPAGSGIAADVPIVLLARVVRNSGAPSLPVTTAMPLLPAAALSFPIECPLAGAQLQFTFPETAVRQGSWWGLYVVREPPTPSVEYFGSSWRYLPNDHHGLMTAVVPVSYLHMVRTDTASQAFTVRLFTDGGYTVAAESQAFHVDDFDVAPFESQLLVADRVRQGDTLQLLPAVAEALAQGQYSLHLVPVHTADNQETPSQTFPLHTGSLPGGNYYLTLWPSSGRLAPNFAGFSTGSTCALASQRVCIYTDETQRIATLLELSRVALASAISPRYWRTLADRGVVPPALVQQVWELSQPLTTGNELLSFVDAPLTHVTMTRGPPGSLALLHSFTAVQSLELDMRFAELQLARPGLLCPEYLGFLLDLPLRALKLTELPYAPGTLMCMRLLQLVSELDDLQRLTLGWRTSTTSIELEPPLLDRPGTARLPARLVSLDVQLPCYSARRQFFNVSTGGGESDIELCFNIAAEPHLRLIVPGQLAALHISRCIVEAPAWTGLLTRLPALRDLRLSMCDVSGEAPAATSVRNVQLDLCAVDDAQLAAVRQQLAGGGCTLQHNADMVTWRLEAGPPMRIHFRVHPLLQSTSAQSWVAISPVGSPAGSYSLWCWGNASPLAITLPPETEPFTVEARYYYQQLAYQPIFRRTLAQDIYADIQPIISRMRLATPPTH